MPTKRSPSWSRWSRTASAKSNAPRRSPPFPTPPSSCCARCATRRRGARKACSSPRACRILTEARDSGRLPEIVAFSPKERKHPLAAEIIAATEAAGGDAIETTPDILSKMSGKDNPQMLLGAYRQPDTALERIDRSKAPLWIVAQALRDPGQYRHDPQDRRRGRRRRADPDRRLRRPLLGRGGARVDGRDVHAGRSRPRAGPSSRLAARRARASSSAPASRRRTTISKPNIASPASC